MTPPCPHPAAQAAGPSAPRRPAPRRRLLCAALAACLLTACGDDAYESPVPMGRYIRYTCNIHTVNAACGQTAGQPQLDSPGGYVRIYDPRLFTAGDEPGVAGFLLLQSGIDLGRFYAFDLACPYCYRQGYTSAAARRVVMMDDGLTARCEACASEFGAVLWGSPAPTAGPANAEGYILRQYRAALLADGYTLVVTK